MLLTHPPKRVVAVGAGFSTATMLDTLLDESDLDVDLTVIDPHPDVVNTLLLPGDRRNMRLVSDKVQEADMAWFTALGDGDVLFIDSTHVLRSGSDVWFLFGQVIPRLASGVRVHVHDIFYPFEYPADWVLQQNRSWNEAYLLRAFLSGNRDFEIEFWNDAFFLFELERIKAECPQFLRNSGGSIWLRRL